MTFIGPGAGSVPVFRIEAARDVSVTLDVGQHGKALVYDHAAGKFVLGDNVVAQSIELPVPTGDAGYFVSAHAGLFNGVVDPISTWGYNYRRDARDDARVGEVAWSIEGDYYALVAGQMRHLAETYFWSNNDAGTAARRWIALTVDKEAPEEYSVIHFMMAPSVYGNIRFIRSDTLAAVFGFNGNGVMGIGGASPQIQFFAANPVIQAVVNTPIAFITNGKYTWVSNSVEGFAFGVAKDASLFRSSSGKLQVAGFLGIGVAPASRLDIGAGAMTMSEMAAPSAPAANGVVLYAEDNGVGKTRLMAKFASGEAQQVAIEP